MRWILNVLNGVFCFGTRIYVHTQQLLVVVLMILLLLWKWRRERKAPSFFLFFFFGGGERIFTWKILWKTSKIVRESSSKFWYLVSFSCFHHSHPHHRQLWSLFMFQFNDFYEAMRPEMIKKRKWIFEHKDEIRHKSCFIASFWFGRSRRCCWAVHLIIYTD